MSFSSFTYLLLFYKVVFFTVSFIIDVGKIKVEFIWSQGGSEVYLCGSFNNWEEKIPLTKGYASLLYPLHNNSNKAKRSHAYMYHFLPQSHDGHFRTIVELLEGIYEYKFIVDGQWLCDSTKVCLIVVCIMKWLDKEYKCTHTGDDQQ